jgi:lipid-binding SYLF domain-containing protein
MKKRSFLAAAAGALVLSACSTTGPGDKGDPATKRASIDAGVDSALATLYTQASGSRELVAKASGVLVFPSVVSAGFVIGGSYGQGRCGSAAGRTATTAPRQARSACSRAPSRSRCTSCS